MALVIAAITVTMAFGQDRIVRLVRSSARYVNKVSGLVLVGAGLFIVWYWATVLSSGSIALSDSGVVRWVDRLSSSVTGFVRERPLVVAGSLVLVAGAAIAALRGRPLAAAADSQPRSDASS